MITRILALVAALLCVAPVHAEYVTTKALLQLDMKVRATQDAGMMAFLTGYVTAVFDATKGPGHCVHEEAVSVDMVMNAVRADETLVDTSADMAILVVLSRMAPPCAETRVTPLPKGQSI